MVQNDNQNSFRSHEDWLDENKPELYLPMIDTAEVVAKRYNIDRETQDEYGLQSQLRTAAGQQAGRFDDEIVPMTTTKIAFDKKAGESWEEEVTLEQDEGNRPTTTLDGLAGLDPVRGEKHCITAGNASQLSDGASACIVMDSKLAEKRGLQPLGIYRGLAVAGCEPDEMGISSHLRSLVYLSATTSKSTILTFGNLMKHLQFKCFIAETSLGLITKN